jgi:hypothetical protein
MAKGADMSTTEITNEQVAQVLDEALALMNDQGLHWTQGTLRESSPVGNKYCALGAIKEATGGLILADREPLRRFAVEALVSVLPYHGDEDYVEGTWQDLMHTITLWNDRRDREWPDIVAKFKEAKQKLIG